MFFIDFFLRFKDTFQEFHAKSRDEISLLETSFSIMLDCYTHVAEMFTFEIAKYISIFFFNIYFYLFQILFLNAF